VANKVLFPGLVRPDERLRPVPDLALSWTESGDGLATTFALRPGVTWHDGTPFTARDVKFTFDQVADLASGSRLRSDFAAVAGVDVIDSLTVRFRLKAPFAPLLTLLGHNAGILPEHVLRGLTLTDAVEFNRATPVGTGPFKVEKHPAGGPLRNDAHYGPCPALPSRLQVVPDAGGNLRRQLIHHHRAGEPRQRRGRPA
jgi:peptide/nickel transport system substrate-binding protein